MSQKRRLVRDVASNNNNNEDVEDFYSLSDELLRDVQVPTTIEFENLFNECIRARNSQQEKFNILTDVANNSIFVAHFSQHKILLSLAKTRLYRDYKLLSNEEIQEKLLNDSTILIYNVFQDNLNLFLEFTKQVMNCFASITHAIENMNKIVNNLIDRLNMIKNRPNSGFDDFNIPTVGSHPNVFDELMGILTRDQVFRRDHVDAATKHVIITYITTQTAFIKIVSFVDSKSNNQFYAEAAALVDPAAALVSMVTFMMEDVVTKYKHDVQQQQQQTRVD